jgi:hypothetical protein
MRLVDGRRATATAIGIAERARDPADKIDNAVAFIPDALDEYGMEVVGAAF